MTERRSSSAPDPAAQTRALAHLLEQTLGTDAAHLADHILKGGLTLARADAGFFISTLGGRQHLVTAKGYDRERLRPLVHHLPAEIAVTTMGESVTEGDAPADWKSNRLLVLPLIPQDQPIGALFLRTREEFAPDSMERQALAEFARLAALAAGSMELLQSMAFDPGTGVHSSPPFFTRLEQEIARSNRYHRKLAVLFLEIDRYHLIEEVSGPAIIRTIARSLAALMREMLRKSDVVGRIHDHQFGVLLPETPIEIARTIAQRLSKKMSMLDFSEGGQKIEVTLSAALIVVPGEAGTMAEVIEASETLLTRARREGGNRVVETGIPADATAAAPEEGAIEHLVLSHEGRTMLTLITRMVRNEGSEPAVFFDHILATLAEVFRARKGMFALLDLQGRTDVANTRYYGRGLQPDHAVIDRVLRERKVLVFTETAEAAAGETRPGLTPSICAPVMSEGKPIAFVYLKGDAGAPKTPPEEIAFLESSLGYLSGPIQKARLFAQQERELAQVREELASSVAQLRTKYSYASIIGRSAPMARIFQILDKVTESHHPVLIQGESGTGKELVARAIHYNGPRREKPFVAENCAALPGTLLEAELFGYVKGAFTGAAADKKGLLEVANGGTFFLDEVGEMSPEMQTKLLRVLEEKEFRPLGGRETIRAVDIRIISATNRDLRRMIQETTFREDLYYRLNVVKIELPPLRERKEDLPLLVEHVLEEIAKESGAARKRLDPEALRLLMACDWPGNVRELENVIKNACVFSEGTVLGAAAFAHLDRLQEQDRAASPALREPANHESYKRLQATLEEQERDFVLRVLKELEYNKVRSSKALNMTRPAFYRMLKRLNIRP